MQNISDDDNVVRFLVEQDNFFVSVCVPSFNLIRIASSPGILLTIFLLDSRFLRGKTSGLIFTMLISN
jgi:hypothetical protein